MTGSFLDFVAERLSYIGPKLFGAIGYHMWFLGFLFAFSLLALPLFVWLKGETGHRVVSRLAGCASVEAPSCSSSCRSPWCGWASSPSFPQLQDWADFFSFGAFFVLGYVLFADERFTRAIRRDWRILLGVGIAATLAAMVDRPIAGVVRHREPAPYVLGIPHVGTHRGLQLVLDGFYAVRRHALPGP